MDVLSRLTVGLNEQNMVQTLLDNMDLVRKVYLMEPQTDLVVRGCPHTLVNVNAENDEYCTTCGEILGVHKMVMGSQMWTHMRRVTQHRYKRLTRLREVMNSVQGLGDAAIPSKVTTNVKEALARRPTETPTPDLVRYLIKVAGHGRYGHFAARIAGMHGYKNRIATPTEKRVIERDFKQVERPWVIILDIFNGSRSDKRSNFMSYPGLVYRLAFKNGIFWLCDAVKPLMIKSPALRQTQELIWLLCCKCLNWEFISRYGSFFPRKKNP
ncbi:MAG: hypothetical protein ACPG77_03720 [Nannocystaceae bacterium]